MSNEHNPIAQLVSQIQNKWNREVTPYSHLRLIRWLIIPSQARLYEGFLRLESTPHGSIPDMIIALLTPFKSPQKHSSAIIKDWVEAYLKDSEAIEAYTQKNPDFDWDAEGFRKKVGDDTHQNNLLFIEMAQAFQEALSDKNRALTFALYPYSIEDTEEYGTWINTLLDLGLPENVRFMIFDYSDERHFDSLMKAHEEMGKSLSIPLDLDGAINKIASGGDPNKPEVRFRHCMMKMFKCVKNSDLSGLRNWGDKALEAAQKSGSKSFFASAHLVYAGMLFNFKEYEEMDRLLQRGLALAQNGLLAGDDSCKPILVQLYGFQGSSKQLQKRMEEAANLFCKQADTAIEYGFAQQPLTAWWMAYSAIKKKDKDRYGEIVSKAYEYGQQQEKETLKSTCMTFIAADYYDILERQRKHESCQKIDDFMSEIEGVEWRSEVATRKKEMEKRKFSLRNWF